MRVILGLVTDITLEDITWDVEVALVLDTTWEVIMGDTVVERTVDDPREDAEDPGEVWEDPLEDREEPFEVTDDLVLEMRWEVIVGGTVVERTDGDGDIEDEPVDGGCSVVTRASKALWASSNSSDFADKADFSSSEQGSTFERCVSISKIIHRVWIPQHWPSLKLAQPIHQVWKGLTIFSSLLDFEGM